MVTPVPAAYDVGVPAVPGEPIVTPVTQELRPQTADRFQLKLGPLQHESAWDPSTLIAIDREIDALEELLRSAG